MTKQITNIKDVTIKAKVDFEGELRDVEVTKFDTKNNVCAFNLIVFGKKQYFGAGKDMPKLSDLKDITFTFKD